jgi:hypothetical protein
MLASTVNPRPRYLLIVRALAGDSTITSAWPAPFDLDDPVLAMKDLFLIFWGTQKSR